jgi:hypothetical protein
MIRVVAMKYLIGLPLLIQIELLWRSRSFKNRGVGVASFTNRGVGIAVGAFVYRLHSPAENHVKHKIYNLWKLNLVVSKVTTTGI